MPRHADHFETTAHFDAQKVRPPSPVAWQMLRPASARHDQRSRDTVRPRPESVPRRHFRTVSLISKVVRNATAITIQVPDELQTRRLFGHVLAIRYRE